MRAIILTIVYDDDIPDPEALAAIWQASALTHEGVVGAVAHPATDEEADPDGYLRA